MTPGDSMRQQKFCGFPIVPVAKLTGRPAGAVYMRTLTDDELATLAPQVEAAVLRKMEVVSPAMLPRNSEARCTDAP